MSTERAEPDFIRLAGELDRAVEFAGWLTPHDFGRLPQEYTAGYHDRVITRLANAGNDRWHQAEGDSQTQTRDRAAFNGHMQRLLEEFVLDSAQEAFRASNAIVARVMGSEQVESALRLDAERQMLSLEERAGFPSDPEQQELVEEYDGWSAKVQRAAGGVMVTRPDGFVVVSPADTEVRFDEYVIGTDGAVTVLDMRADPQRLHDLADNPEELQTYEAEMRVEAALNNDPRRLTHPAELHGVLGAVDSTVDALADIEGLSIDELRQRLDEPPLELNM